MINPCVVIATHDRLQITTVNIKQLISQGVKVVLVVTDINERKHYDNYDVHIVMAPNNPLGAKWQAGVDFASTLDPSHIVITGSDDLLSVGFFHHFCRDSAFTGFNHWYIWNQNKLHLLKYLPQQPLGGGRVYSKHALEMLKYKLFDVTKNKLLDDRAWIATTKSEWNIVAYPEILAIKGNWPVMNKVDLNHRNVKLIATYEGEEALKIMKTKFDYEPKRLLPNIPS
jgi:hypothetical protein